MTWKLEENVSEDAPDEEPRETWQEQRQRYASETSKVIADQIGIPEDDATYNLGTSLHQEKAPRATAWALVLVTRQLKRIADEMEKRG